MTIEAMGQSNARSWLFQLPATDVLDAKLSWHVPPCPHLQRFQARYRYFQRGRVFDLKGQFIRGIALDDQSGLIYQDFPLLSDEDFELAPFTIPFDIDAVQVIIRSSREEPDRHLWQDPLLTIGWQHDGHRRYATADTVIRGEVFSSDD